MRPCIYKVPSQMREGKPDAYTPRIVLIGLLHRSLKPKLKPSEDKKNKKKLSDDVNKKKKKKEESSDDDDAETSNRTGHLKKKTRKLYEGMEDIKKAYLAHFTDEVGEDVVKKIRGTIIAEEENIRGSYAVKFEEMTSEFFGQLILLDSVFVMEFIRRLQGRRTGTSDNMIMALSQAETVIGDLFLLENQLPYFIFDKLFGVYYETLRHLGQQLLKLFSPHIKTRSNTSFDHFTDMFRCVYVQSLDRSPKLNDLSGAAIRDMNNAVNLSLAGVEFKAAIPLNSPTEDRIHRQSSRNQELLDSLPISVKINEVDEYSLHMEFEKGCLVMSSFRVDVASDKILRNVVAYEQCHGLTPFTSNYIRFMNFLITSDGDVDILKKAGVLTQCMGRASLTLEMVNKLTVGLTESTTSQYHSIAVSLQAHYQSRAKRYWATLKKVYFTDLWTGTATIVAILILVMTFVGTVASVIQTYISLYPLQPYANSIII
ncbi:unnamed protein product [Thlaspi arvense]|uniref:Uncharacterized protein n=1 Tax=Thlaspi arvense TaxID=13288 RepID=A0AAU9SRP6_THLAR|nr:unnamed protein product [Thlaspi arvense]